MLFYSPLRFPTHYNSNIRWLEGGGCLCEILRTHRNEPASWHCPPIPAGQNRWVVRRGAALRIPAADGWTTPSSNQTPAGCRCMGTVCQPSEPTPLPSSPCPNAVAYGPDTRIKMLATKRGFELNKLNLKKQAWCVLTNLQKVINVTVFVLLCTDLGWAESSRQKRVRSSLPSSSFSSLIICRTRRVATSLRISALALTPATHTQIIQVVPIESH